MKHSDYAWIALTVQGLVYEGLDDDVLSHATDRYCEMHPILFRILVLMLAGHFGSLLPCWADVFCAHNPMHRFIVRYRNKLIVKLYERVVERKAVSGEVSATKG